MKNILDVDTEAHWAYEAGEGKGAVILFDFKAAFPSIEHDFMWNALSQIGMPQNWIEAIKFLYVSNFHVLKLNGGMHSAFYVESGVRQGCPLSPILFALCADLFLRRLRSSVSPGDEVKAYRRHCPGVPRLAQDTTEHLRTV